jgi:hypothetical protein
VRYPARIIAYANLSVCKPTHTYNASHSSLKLYEGDSFAGSMLVPRP